MTDSYGSRPWIRSTCGNVIARPGSQWRCTSGLTAIQDTGLEVQAGGTVVIGNITQPTSMGLVCFVPPGVPSPSDLSFGNADVDKRCTVYPLPSSGMEAFCCPQDIATVLVITGGGACAGHIEDQTAMDEANGRDPVRR